MNTYRKYRSPRHPKMMTDAECEAFWHRAAVLKGNDPTPTRALPENPPRPCDGHLHPRRVATERPSAFDPENPARRYVCDVAPRDPEAEYRRERRRQLSNREPLWA